MKKILIIILCLSLTIGIVGCGTTNDESNGKTVLNIGKVPYVHEWIPANIIAKIAMERGYETNLVEGDIGFVFLGLSQGDIDIYPDVWLPVLHKNYMDKYEKEIDLIGTLYKKIELGLYVPSYVDFDSIEDLKENADLVGNRIVGIEPSTGVMLTTEKTIKEYGLEDSIELIAGSTPAMLAELDRAIKTKEPIVIIGWHPHTMFTKYDIKKLEDTKDVWAYDDNMIGANKELNEKAPDIYKFCQSLKFSISEIEDMLLEMENGKTIDEVTDKWIEENREAIDKVFE